MFTVAVTVNQIKIKLILILSGDRITNFCKVSHYCLPYRFFTLKTFTSMISLAEKKLLLYLQVQ